MILGAFTLPYVSCSSNTDTLKYRKTASSYKRLSQISFLLLFELMRCKIVVKIKLLPLKYETNTRTSICS